MERSEPLYMDRPADFDVRERDGTRWVIPTGDWTAINLDQVAVRLTAALSRETVVRFDLSQVARCDTAGAFAILNAGRGRIAEGGLETPPALAPLFQLVEHATRVQTKPPPRPWSIYSMVERLGRGLVDAGGHFYETLIFFGHLLVAIGRVSRNPSRIRWAACFSLAERAGLDAIPIVAITTFFIGAVVGFLGANELAQFGAQVFAVELIGIAVMREFNIVITAVLLAGRSASSFAAEIGAMKMSQEIDAMRTMGVDPFEALVLPRFLALLITIPLLAFVATLAGLAGGMLVCWSVLNISPNFFVERLVQDVGATHFWIGMSKAPVMAITIAGVGCRQGLEVGGDVESLGRRVTTAVVHAIFSIILIDAVFALVYMKLNV
jgi:phospholipid/cholesterol/gamma-HCH transport system permease protein